MERVTLNNPEQVKYEKKDKERQFSQLASTFEVNYKSHYFDYTCPPVFTILSVFTKEQWFLSIVNAHSSLSNSLFSPLLSSSSPSSECRFPTTGFEVGLEGS